MSAFSYFSVRIVPYIDGFFSVFVGVGEPHVLLLHCLFFFFFFFCFSVLFIFVFQFLSMAVISITLSSTSFILPSAAIILLLIPSGEIRGKQKLLGGK